MSQIINTNIASLTAQRNLNNSQTEQATALQRLSSGLRINSARDDAAGLAISTRFSSQTRGLAVAIRNAGDGISLAQTAEGALGSLTDSLQRIRELALQAANGTNSDSDRQALNSEAQQLIAEITRTGEQTNFNGRNLLDGSFNSAFQIGANAGETISVSVEQLTSDVLGVSADAGVSSVGTDNALGNGDLIINGVAIGPSNASDDTASTDNAAASAIAKVAAINAASEETGVTAVIDANIASGTEQVAPAATTSGTVTINGTTINIDATTDTSTTRAGIAAAINAESELTGVRAVDTGDDALGITLVADDGRNIQVALSGVTAAETGLTAAGTFEGGFTLVADGDVSEINISGGNGTGNGDLANAGLSAGSFTPGVASVTSTAQTSQLASVANITIGGAGNSAIFDIQLGTLGTDAVSLSAGITDAAEFVTAINADLGAEFLAVDNGDGTVSINVVASAAASNAGADLVIHSANSTAAALLGVTSSGVSTADTSTIESDFVVDALADGDLVINGVAIGGAADSSDTASYEEALSSDKAASGIALAAAINDVSDSTGVTASVNATELTGGTDTTAATAGTTLNLYINGVSIGVVTASGNRDDDLAATVDAINNFSGQTGVLAADNGVSISLSAADGRNISIVASLTSGAGTNDGSGFGLDTDTAGIGSISTAVTTATAAQVLNGYETVTSTVQLQSAGEIEIQGGGNGVDDLQDIGLEAGTFGGAANGQFLTEVDISTLEGANAALTAIDNALDSVNAARADLGAVQNRFETTISNLAVAQENLTAANSRIRDADFAAETAELSRTQVLQQAGISILAQANALPQQALSLLQ